MSAYSKWREGTLTQEDCKVWAKREPETEGLDDKQLDHVAMCLHHLYLWYTKDQPLGHFLSAVLQNDFMEACGRADDTNSKVLPIYAKFLYNIAPMDYKNKAKEYFNLLTYADKKVLLELIDSKIDWLRGHGDPTTLRKQIEELTKLGRRILR